MLGHGGPRALAGIAVLCKTLDGAPELSVYRTLLQRTTADSCTVSAACPHRPGYEVPPRTWMMLVTTRPDQYHGPRRTCEDSPHHARPLGSNTTTMHIPPSSLDRASRSPRFEYILLQQTPRMHKKTSCIATLQIMHYNTVRTTTMP